MTSQRPSLLEIFWSRLRKERKPAPARAPVSRFQAVTIFHGLEACEMARELGDRRFLARNAPALPLPGCTMSDSCECRYLKFKDRRAESRRLGDFFSASRLYAATDRRHYKGRRGTD